MSLFWPVFWLFLMLSAVVATIVVAFMEQSKAKAAARQLEASRFLPDEAALQESMDSLDNFPADGNLDFPQSTS